MNSGVSRRLASVAQRARQRQRDDAVGSIKVITGSVLNQHQSARGHEAGELQDIVALQRNAPERPVEVALIHVWLVGAVDADQPARPGIAATAWGGGKPAN